MLSVMLPHTNCEKFQPYIKISDEGIMVGGKRKSWLSTKNAQKLEKYEKRIYIITEKIDKT